MMRVVAIALLLLATVARADWVLTPKGDARAGEPLTVDVLLANEGTSSIADGLPARLPARVLYGQRSIDVTLEAINPPALLGAPIAPGTFRRQSYRATLPQDAIGPLTITLLQGARTIVVAEPPRADAADRSLAAADAALTPHEPMYFIVGTRSTTSAKMQLSFKYRLLDETTWLGRNIWPLAKLHFAYTQTSIWDIGEDSAPFRDTSYRPSLFYYEPRVWTSRDGLQSMSFSTGLEHESNGKDGLNSRSMNIAFIRPRWRYGFDDGYFLRFDAKVYAYIERSDNPDIGRYRGYGDYAIGVGRADEWLLNTTLRKGTGGPGYGSIQMDLSYRIRQRIFANASGYVYAQYFNGYGESLLDYDVHRRSQFRLGFAIVR